ncbi:MAG: hypothetical protein AAGB04_24010 [Pseudomonadota bacterium]
MDDWKASAPGDLIERDIEFRKLMHMTKSDLLKNQYIAHRAGRVPSTELGQIYSRTLRPYLTYVNANIALSKRLSGMIYDWPDIVPFYEFKAEKAADKDAAGNTASTALRKLFEFTFPEISELDLRTTLKFLKDRRTESLRKTISQALESAEEIDQEFVVRTLREVIGDERTAARRSKLISYATSPLGFVPLVGTPLQKAAEEAADLVSKRVNPSKHPWYIMVSETIGTTAA